MLEKLTLTFVLCTIVVPSTVFTTEQPHERMIQPGDKMGEAFTPLFPIYGFLTGLVPIVGQATVATSFAKLLYNKAMNQPPQKYDMNFKQASLFACGHVIGTAIWAIPSYLLYNHLTTK